MDNKSGWKLKEWNNHFWELGVTRTAMTQVEIDEAIKYLRDANYPKPEDCLEAKCPKYRPACKLGICRIAVGMCGDF